MALISPQKESSELRLETYIEFQRFGGMLECDTAKVTSIREVALERCLALNGLEGPKSSPANNTTFQ